MSKDNPLFRGFRRPNTDFASVQSDFQTTPLYVDIDLSSARSLAAGSALRLPIAGNTIFIDQKSNSGFATVHFQDDARAGNTPVTVFPGFIARVPFTYVLIENEAQAGQILRLIYGVDIDFVPTAGAGVSVLNAVNVADLINPTCQLVPTPGFTGIGANQVVTVLAAAANVNGVNIREVYLGVTAGAGGQINAQIVAAATAPVSLYAAKAACVVLATAESSSSSDVRSVEYIVNRRIPAGWGVFHIGTITVAAALRNTSVVSLEVL